MSVALSIHDHVATVTLNRPQAMNAVDLATEAELQRIWAQIEIDPEVRVVVLTGAGDRAFCAGADLKNPSVTGLEYWAAPRTGGFGGTSEVCGALSDLRHRTWRRGELVGVDRLNGVNDRNVGTLALQGGKNFFKLNFGQHLDLAVV